MRTRIFVDFWNFSLQWNRRSDGKKPDWKNAPCVLRDAARDSLAQSQLGNIRLEETRVYASYEPGRDPKLKSFLNTFLDRQPGIRVFAVERHWKQRPIHCRNCNHKIENCPKCDKPLGKASEKTVDAQIVTDLISLAWEDAYDIALLVSSDRDFVPAVERLQEKNKKIINATWRGYGYELARVCWASFELDSYIEKIARDF